MLQKAIMKACSDIKVILVRIKVTSVVYSAAFKSFMTHIDPN